MSILNNIIDAFLGLSLEGQIAVLLMIALFIFAVESVIHVRRSRAKRVRHRQVRSARARANSNKEDFFDMVTRLRSEIDFAPEPV